MKVSACKLEIQQYLMNLLYVVFWFWCQNTTVDSREKISNTFLLIFPSFLCLLSTKLMAKWSKVPSQLSWGQKLSTKVNFDIFSSFQFSKIPQIFKYFCSCAFLWISANLELIPINFIGFKVPPDQFWSSGCVWFN